MTNDLTLFTSTADQRFLLGDEAFLETHFPMEARSYTSTGKTVYIDEDDLLEQLLAARPDTLGNRIWLLYGAPGSGKSELIRWLQLRLGHTSPERDAVTVRIARNELNTLTILKKFLQLLPNHFLSDVTAERWQIARQKSRTLTKLILIFTLERMLESDESINALFYRLIDIVHSHIERILNSTTFDLDQSKSIELISLEAWNAVAAETAIGLPLDYEQFRQQLTVAFQDQMLEGLSLSNIMSEISNVVGESKGLRPILLLDDLVQSLNVFATDVLDYLLNLEAGNWDVVLGLTPAAFEDSERGRTLLQRIAYLDTIDDRVDKLWLSDEAGLESYVLTEENCARFASKYLTYASVSTGDSLGIPPNTRKLLSNDQLCIRLYRGLPKGKGKPRYYVRYLREILLRTAGGEDILEVLRDYVVTEYVARVDDQRLALSCEYFGPLLHQSPNRAVSLPNEIVEALELPPPAKDVVVEPLVQTVVTRTSTTKMIYDEEKGAVRDWLSGLQVNRQLLKGIRQGVARWMRLSGFSLSLHRIGVARPFGVLRWDKPYMGVRPAVYLEGIDVDNVGEPALRLSPNIGTTAFDLQRLATATGLEAKALVQDLAGRPELLPLLEQGYRFQTELHEKFNKQASITLEELSLALLIFSHALRKPSWIPPGFTEQFADELEDIQTRWSRWFPEVGKALLDNYERLFLDVYRLRENIIDGLTIRRVIGNRSPLSTLSSLTQVTATELSPNFRLANKPLYKLVESTQSIVEHWLDKSDGQRPLSRQGAQLLKELRQQSSNGVAFNGYHPSIWQEISESLPADTGHLAVVWRSLQ